MSVRILVGDCREHMAAMDAESVDAIVTDPPYGLEFMGKEWDRLAPTVGSASFRPTAASTAPIKSTFKSGVGTRIGAPKKNPRCNKCGRLKFDHAHRKCQCESPDWDTRTAEYAREMQQWHESWAIEAYRVLKPGGHMLAFGGTRTHHRLMVAIEDAGFEIRDCLMWLYGSGFPKSLDVSKAMDKVAGAEREVVASNPNKRNAHKQSGRGFDSFLGTEVLESMDITAPATDLARQWDGWGTALKPAWEPIIMARKPLMGTVARNVEAFGTGAINVKGCRIGTDGRPARTNERSASDLTGTGGAVTYGSYAVRGSVAVGETTQGRWPANLILDEEAAALLDAQSGERPAGGKVTGRQQSRTGQTGIYGHYEAKENNPYFDSGGASRFFYTAKASRSERNKGLDGMPESNPWDRNSVTRALEGLGSLSNPRSNHHPTVKPLDLMQWLCRLVTPPGGTVLDCFGGSGSTMVAADREGFNGIYIDLDAEYAEIARRRVYGDAPLFAQVSAD